MNREALEAELARLNDMIASNQYAGSDGVVLFDVSEAVILRDKIVYMLSEMDPNAP